MNIGKVLHEARTKSNKSLQQIHELTKVAIEHLEFLEANNFGFLPSTYVRAFLKSYADVIGVDPLAVMKAYDTSLEHPVEQFDLRQEVTRFNLAPALKEKIVEWCLGFGTLILLIALIFVYIQYRSHIHAEPVTLGNPSGQDALVAGNGGRDPSQTDSGDPSFRIEVVTRDSAWFDLKIDGITVDRHQLKPGQNIIWTAEQRIDVSISRNSGAEDTRPAGARESSLTQPQKSPEPQ